MSAEYFRNILLSSGLPEINDENRIQPSTYEEIIPYIGLIVGRKLHDEIKGSVARKCLRSIGEIPDASYFYTSADIIGNSGEVRTGLSHNCRGKFINNLFGVAISVPVYKNRFSVSYSKLEVGFIKQELENNEEENVKTNKQAVSEALFAIINGDELEGYQHTTYESFVYRTINEKRSAKRKMNQVIGQIS